MLSVSTEFSFGSLESVFWSWLSDMLCFLYSLPVRYNKSYIIITRHKNIQTGAINTFLHLIDCRWLIQRNLSLTNIGITISI